MFKKGIIACALMAISFAQGQENPLPTEKLIIIKPYSPTVSDAFKVKQTPKRSDSLITQKKQPEYKILSVPVASTFVPEKGKAAAVETVQRNPLYDNYAVLGFGNYNRILAEFYSTIAFDNAQDLSFFLRHHSSQGGVDDVLLDDKFYDTEIGADFSSNSTYYNWGVDFDAMHKLVNWYGLPESYASMPVTVAGIDPQQTYYGVSVGGNIEYYEGLFDGAELKYRRFGDAYGSGENYVDFVTEFGVPVGEQTISLDISVGYLNGHFDKRYLSQEEINYSTFDVGAHPSLMIHAGNFSMDLGASLVYQMNIEEDKNEFYLYPKIKASYRFVEGYFVPYAGVDGGLITNTYYDFVQENPFVSPTLYMLPTSISYNAFLGAKGKFTETVSYNFRADYLQAEHEAFFVHNRMAGIPSSLENYENGNSFGLVYDDMTTLAFHGELGMDVNEDFQLRLNASYFSYDVEALKEAWNLPELKASLNANYQITEKWSAGADLFFVGERKDRKFVVFDPSPATSSVTLDSYFDVNLEVGYQFTPQLSAFVKGNNLLGENYEHWLNYPVLGIQVLGGVTYQFDW